MATPGYPDVGTHTDGACGCGDTHAPAAVTTTALAAAGTPTFEPPRFLQASMLQTPAGFQSPPLTGAFDVNTLLPANWKDDWWKYVVGAVAYRLFFA